MKVVHKGSGFALYIPTGSTGQPQKCKYDARLASGMQPHSSKQSLMSKTDDLDPIIITTALNLTLNCMVDIMKRTLDATAAPSTPTPSTAPPPSPPIINPSIESSQPLSASMSSVEILDQAIRIISGIDCYNFELLSDSSLYSCLVLGKLSIVYSCLLGSRFNLSSPRVPLVGGIV